MELSLPATLSVTLLAFIVFGFANWRARQPAQPFKVRMINYHLVQLVCLIVILLMAAHLVTLFVGGPVTGQPGPRPL